MSFEEKCDDYVDDDTMDDILNVNITIVTLNKKTPLNFQPTQRHLQLLYRLNQSI